MGVDLVVLRNKSAAVLKLTLIVRLAIDVALSLHLKFAGLASEPDHIKKSTFARSTGTHDRKDLTGSDEAAIFLEKLLLLAFDRHGNVQIRPRKHFGSKKKRTSNKTPLSRM
jgi:hypothetical protein